MKYSSISEFYESLRKKKVPYWRAKRIIVQKFDLEFVGDGQTATVFSKKGFGFVVKFSRKDPLPEPRTKLLKKVFIGYQYLSNDKRFAIQKKLKIKSYSGKVFCRTRFSDKQDLPIEIKFKNKYPRLYRNYDIHFENIGILKGELYLIDF